MTNRSHWKWNVGKKERNCLFSSKTWHGGIHLWNRLYYWLVAGRKAYNTGICTIRSATD